MCVAEALYPLLSRSDAGKKLDTKPLNGVCVKTRCWKLWQADNIGHDKYYNMQDSWSVTVKENPKLVVVFFKSDFCQKIGIAVLLFLFLFMIGSLNLAERLNAGVNLKLAFSCCQSGLCQINGVDPNSVSCGDHMILIHVRFGAGLALAPNIYMKMKSMSHPTNAKYSFYSYKKHGPVHAQSL